MKSHHLSRLLLLALLPVSMLAARAETVASKRSAYEDRSVIRSAGLVHDLPYDQAQRAKAIIQGVVTYYDPIELFLFVQDKTGGVFVDIGQPYPVHAGDLVRVEGYTARGYRTEITTHPLISVLGRQDFPRAVLSRYGDLMSGSRDSKLTRIRGTIRAADVERHQAGDLIHLDIEMHGGEAQVYLPASVQFDPMRLLDTTIEFTGVAGGTFDANEQLTGVVLYGRSLSDIRVITQPTTKLATYAMSSPDDIAQSREVVDTSRRLRIRGIVTSYRKGEYVVLESGDRGVYVATRRTSDIAIGEIVDAFGFASDREYAPSLRQATLFDTGLRGLPQNHVVSFDQAVSGLYSDELITITGRLVSQQQELDSDTLTFDVEGHLVRAVLNNVTTLRPYPIGSRVRLTGICHIISGGPWRAASFFRLDMRSADDIEVLLAPSWWTVQHLSLLLGGCSLVALAILAWATSLRRRVRAQTKRLERSVLVARERNQILEMLSSDKDFTDVLTHISLSLKVLLPTTSCVMDLSSELPEMPSIHAASGAATYYETALLDCDNENIGSMRIRCKTPADLPRDAWEVCKVLGDLAVLAGRQSSFHQGLLHHSTHDVLTELPNRRLLDRRLTEAIEKASAKQSNISLIYIDINKFKMINDEYGHTVGDLYLCELSARFKCCTRSTDTLARVGGDEFVLMASPSNQTEGMELVGRLRRCFEEPFVLGSVTIQGSASFGLAVFPEDGNSAEDLKRLADHAMYADKRKDAGTERGLGLTVLTPEELNDALHHGRGHLVYQPQFTAAGVLSGMEALLRVEDPILGVLTPGSFIDAAEKSDLIVEIGKWVLERAVREAIHWNLHLGDHLLIAVNVAAKQAQQPNFAESVISFLGSVGFPPDRLELELVERSLAGSGEEISRQLCALRQAGVRVALDDFGTGESSLTMLHKLPIDTLKIDRRFTAAMETEPDIIPIIKAIADMAFSLRKRLVAEGIDSASVVSLLPDAARMQFQGYLFGLPVMAPVVSASIQQWRMGITMPSTVDQDQNICSDSKISKSS